MDEKDTHGMGEYGEMDETRLDGMGGMMGQGKWMDSWMGGWAGTVGWDDGSG